jgi:C-terminal processing protease CtpA/Prc
MTVISGLPRWARLAAVVLAFFMAGVAQAQEGEPDLPIAAAQRSALIDGILGRLSEHYVLTGVAARLERDFRARARRGDYDRITSSRVMAATLSSQLREAANDAHLAVRFSHAPIEAGPAATPTLEDQARARRMAASVNFGFERVERLNGNIGYIELDGFADPDQAGETAIAAMNFLANTDALIIDLRFNGGGVPGIAQLISSYLFERPVHLNSIHWREGNRTQQYWTLPYVPGARYLNKPVFILTSRHVLSAPESFAYSLQALRRATIVGATTAGGANPGREFRINEHFAAFIPTGRAVNPVTGTNWEGVGIRPDIAVPAARALRTAHLAALRHLLAAASSERSRASLEGIIQEVQAQPE